jgi:hypothetical protein
MAPHGASGGHVTTDFGSERRHLQSLAYNLQPGDHLFHSYDSPSEPLPLLVSFIAAGLDQNQQCIHISGDYLEEPVMAELQAWGVDAVRASQRGGLRFLGPSQWKRQAELDPAVILEGLASLVAQGLQAGYGGIRMWFDMTWTLHPGVDPLGLEAMETLFHRVIQDEPVIAVCPYQCRRLPAATIKVGENTHPWCINGNRLLPNEHSRLAALFAKHATLLRRLVPPSRPRLADA